MATNLCGEKMCIHQDDEIRYVFTPIEQNYNRTFCFGQALEKKRGWANKVGLIGMFEIEWKTP